MNAFILHHHHPWDSSCLVELGATTICHFLNLAVFLFDHFPSFEFSCLLFILNFVQNSTCFILFVDALNSVFHPFYFC